ncbi:DUF2062 domain-containing protein [Enhygromyxa salina]|uniref:DUF2062 domain-containing protein n=1 Tax=Enhygromyxa salina TaxID=215803 RepID=UPI0015E5FCD9|nr:DUF2062 domain-containing protein [Enhygromyxa salina]
MLYRLRQGALRLVRLNASPHGIALGFTLGLSLSLFPIPFLGMLAALALAPLLRASLPATYAGSAMVNPLTGAAIYFGELWVGSRLTGVLLPAWAEVRYYDWREWWSLFTSMIPTFLLGALVLMVGAAVLCYPTLRWTAAAYRRRHPAEAPATAHGSETP